MGCTPVGPATAGRYDRRSGYSRTLRRRLKPDFTSARLGREEIRTVGTATKQAVDDECVQEVFAAAQVDLPQSGRLHGRELEAGHLFEFRAHSEQRRLGI